MTPDDEPLRNEIKLTIAGTTPQAVEMIPVGTGKVKRYYRLLPADPLPPGEYQVRLDHVRGLAVVVQP
jgi:hypothetical protein